MYAFMYACMYFAVNKNKSFREIYNHKTNDILYISL